MQVMSIRAIAETRPIPMRAAIRPTVMFGITQTSTIETAVDSTPAIKHHPYSVLLAVGYALVMSAVGKLPKPIKTWLENGLTRFTERVFPHVLYRGHGELEFQSRQFGLSPSKLDAAVERLKPTVKPLLEKLEEQSLPDLLPDANTVQRLAAFDLAATCKGVPPSLVRQTKDKPPKTLGSTRGLINSLALNLVSQLPPASSVFEAVTQLATCYELVGEKTREKTRPIKPHASLSDPSILIKPSGRLNYAGVPIRSLLGKQYASLQTRHMAVIAPSGSITVYELPTPAAMLTMLKDDPGAQAFIDRMRPLPHNPMRFFLNSPYRRHNKNGLTAQQVIEAYAQAADGKDTLQETSYGWNHTHSLLALVPFDIDRHIQAGRLKTVFHKPAQTSDVKQSLIA